MDLKRVINILTVVIIAIIFILIAGNFLYIHDNADVLNKNPLYFAAGIAFVGGGAGILFGLLLKNTLPRELYNEISDIKR